MSVADKYLTALQEFERADDRVKQTAVRITEFCAKLESHPAHTTLTGVKAEILFGTDALTRTYSMKGADWPNAEEMQALISRWHETYRAMTEAWKAVPDDWKSNFKEPPYKAARL